MAIDRARDRRRGNLVVDKDSCYGRGDNLDEFGVVILENLLPFLKSEGMDKERICKIFSPPNFVEKWIKV